MKMKRFEWLKWLIYHLSDGAADGVRLVGAGGDASDRINVDEVQLNRSVIFSADDTITGRAVREIEFES